MADVTLKAVLVGEDRSLSKAMKGASGAVEDVGKKSKIAGGVMKGALSAAAITTVADAVVDFGRDSVEAYRDAAASQRQLDDAFKRFPALANVSKDALRELNQAIQDKTGADADDIASGQAVLARYKLTGQQLKEMTPLLVDYATRTGKSIPEASTQLGKALGGSGRAMKELGIKFKDTGDPAKNFKQIMTGLQEKVGGFANKEAGTLDGKLKKLQTRFGDVQESVGEALLPALIGAGDALSQLVGWVQQNASWLGPLAAGIGATAGAFMLLNAVMALNPFVLIVVAIGALVGGLIWCYQNVTWFRDGVNAAFQAIGAIGRWLWNNALAPALRGIVGGFANVIDGVANFLDALGNIPGFGWAKVAAAGLRLIADKARGAADAIKDIPDPKVETSPAKKRVDELKAKINSIKGKIVEAKAKGDDKAVVNLKRKLDGLKRQYNIALNVQKTGIRGIHVNSVGGGNLVVRAVAQGGPTKKGAPYWVGEHGPELFTPGMDGHINNKFQIDNALAAAARNSGSAAPSPMMAPAAAQTPGDMQVSINMQGLTAGPKAFAEAIERELYALQRGRGPGGQLSFQKR